MNSDIENKVFEEINIGDTCSVNRVIKRQDVELFAITSGDVNPTHLDDDFVKSENLPNPTLHSVWIGGLFSSLLGNKLPGPGTKYLSQTMDFAKTAYIGDELTATVTVIKKHPATFEIEFDCKCVNQTGDVITHGVAKVTAPIKKIKRTIISLPFIHLSRVEKTWYNSLLTAKSVDSPLKTAVVHAIDKTSLVGAVLSEQDGLIEPVLIGPKEIMYRVAAEEKLDISQYSIIDSRTPEESAAIAVKLAANKEVGSIMKGKLHTDELLRPIVKREGGLRTSGRISHTFVMHVPSYHKPLFITDAAININPDLETKKAILENAIDLFKYLGLGKPKIAIVSATENVDENMPSTLDATALCKMADRGQICDAIIDGPLAFDNAISAESAAIKGIKSPVAGDADIIMVPNIESGNILYKQMTYLCGMESAGIVLGAKVPIILTSRGSSDISRKASCALAMIYERGKRRAGI